MKKQEFFISTADEKLHCIQWLPDSSPILVLQIVHGMVEYIDRYDEFASYLTDRGIAVVGHDQPGHGFTAPNCLCYSDMSHLYAHGPDMIHDNHFPL